MRRNSLPVNEMEAVESRRLSKNGGIGFGTRWLPIAPLGSPLDSTTNFVWRVEGC
jgi:hypothetical protein